MAEAELAVTAQWGVSTQHFSSFFEPNSQSYSLDSSSMKISTIGGNASETSDGLRGLK